MEIRLKEVMAERGMKSVELAEKLGVNKAAVSKYEKGIVENLKRSMIKNMADTLKVKPSYLMCFDEEQTVQGEQISKGSSLIDQFKQKHENHTSELLEVFGALNDEGQRETLNLIERFSEIPRYQKNPVVPMRSIPVFDSPAAAGSPLYAESEFEYIDFPVSEIPEGTDFGVRISGQSMQPTIEDGAVVWVEKTVELHNGEVGVFMLNDSAVCKRLRLDDFGRVVALESDNPEYDSIRGSDLEGLKPVGRVIL
jgi:SOS-response transcriptional repressor LexA